jgi:hypothetical protein
VLPTDQLPAVAGGGSPPGQGPPRADAAAPPYDKEYEQVNHNFRMLADVRFKLLALVPPLGGVAVFLLTQLALAAPAAEPPAPKAGEAAVSPRQPDGRDCALVLVLSSLGFLVTLGITCYDQRNSEFYNALTDRARELERRLNLDGGQFLTRPPRGRWLGGLLLIWHDAALAMIYGPVLGAWAFPAAYSVLSWAGWRGSGPFVAALLVCLAAVAVCTAELLRLGAGGWKKLWEELKGRWRPESANPSEPGPAGKPLP